MTASAAPDTRAMGKGLETLTSVTGALPQPVQDLAYCGILTGIANHHWGPFTLPLQLASVIVLVALLSVARTVETGQKVASALGLDKVGPLGLSKKAD